MKSNKIDTNIKEKLANRTFEPSASAWERLSTQLDQQSKQQKKGWFFYIGYAASILVLISIGVYLLSNKEVVIIPENIIVDTPIDTVIIKNKIDKIFNEIPVEEVIVKNEKKVKEIKPKNVSSITEKKSKKKVNTIANNVNIIKKEINKKEIAFFSYDKRTANLKNAKFIQEDGIYFSDFVSDLKEVINKFKVHSIKTL